MAIKTESERTNINLFHATSLAADSTTSVQTELVVVAAVAWCGFHGGKNRPTPIPGQMSYKVTQPGSVSLCLSSLFIVLLFVRATFCIVRLSWYVFCLSVVLVKLSVLACQVIGWKDFSEEA